MEHPGDLVRRYEDLLQLSREMLQLARQGQWDELVLRERAHASLVADLAVAAATVPVPPADGLRISELIELILKLDSETQLLAHSWKNELQGLLESMSTERKLSHAYGP